MKSVFIADAHLREPTDINYRRLLLFLESLRHDVDTLYIMGDLFEFWIGYRRCAFPRYLPVIDSLASLRAAGVGIEYFEGNHDFHLGPVFEKDLAAVVHPGPAVRSIHGRRVYLCHGDQINRSDYGYRLQRLVFHSPLTRLLTAVVPPQAAQALAERLSRQSRQNHSRRGARWDYRGIVRSFAADRFKEGNDALVTGHFHMPFLETIGSGTLLSLGDWISDFSYGTCDSTGFRLETFIEGSS